VRRFALWSAALLLLVVLVAAVVYGPRLRRMAGVGAGYVAKQTCSCMYVAGRPFDACRSDLPSSMDRIRAEVLDGLEGVRASAPFLERRAHHTPGRGCTLQPWN
jgi:hypothetical protein